MCLRICYITIMKISYFDFKLPQKLIAQYPCSKRSGSRLLCLDKDSGAIAHRKFFELPDLLSPKDLLIFNNTKVIPARLFGIKATGGKVELLIERVLNANQALAHIKASKSPKIGNKIILQNDFVVEILEHQENLFLVEFKNADDVFAVLNKIGRIPLPPYIEREDEKIDKQRYQTVFAKDVGAVAAPTAGLHFDAELMQKLEAKRIATAFITLHVGAGTFQPVRVSDINQHKMHSEYAELSPAVCEQIKITKQQGGRIIAVGTTCVRTLETASRTGVIKPFKGETDIFIYPSFEFRCADALITNFHLPKSTLLMMVCAFAGYDNVMRTYKIAIKDRYRFFSYGDAMLILN